MFLSYFDFTSSFSSELYLFESILFIQYVFCSFAAPGNFVDAFSNGYLLGELLHKYGLQVRKIYLQNLTRILETK